ncbi:MAG: PQQ-like beta-propeller repeat protein [Pirellulales bacterium]|nr:PQQ-like beta-propeller repeat protein [Pirellulales bacterium]
MCARRLIVFTGGVAATCLAWHALGVAQPVLQNVPQAVEADFQGVSLPSNRTDTLGIRRVRERIAQGEFSQAIRFLDEVLSRPEDSFLLSGIRGEYVGLKETVWKIIRDLPPAGQQAYQTTFGPVARRLLQQAVADGDFEKLRMLTRRYFHTPSGYEAAILLAQHEADMGRHLSAALIFQQLLDTPAAAARFEPQLSLQAGFSWLALGNQARAEQLFQNIDSANHQSVRVGGQNLRLDRREGNILDKLLQSAGSPTGKDIETERHWLTFHGNPQRNGQPEGGLPHMRVDWQVRLLTHPALEAAHDELSAGRGIHQQPVIPAAAPLAVGNYLITRSAHNLIAVDFTTGKRVWQVQPQRFSAFERLINGGGEEENDGELEPALAFAQRIWEDYLYNTISSDGQRVYVIRDLKAPRLNRYGAFVAPFMRQAPGEAFAEGTNRLCAYDLETQGKLVWEVDGAVNQEQLKGAFFLGAPLAVGKSLYCLAEKNSEKAIYLFALDRQTGKLLWRQQLANLETGILVDLNRRLQAVIPSYDEGVLVCPTGVGVVVGVDLAKQSLAWAYHYKSEQRLSNFMRNRGGRRTQSGNQWVQGAMTIAEGRVLLSPPESNALHCLDLATGALLWKQPRRQGLFVAGVDEDIVLVVGQEGFSALRLEDGKPAWKHSSLGFPQQSYPTGQGFLSQGKYHLPLSNAEVIAVDVGAGEIVGKAVGREGRPLGNLICHRGTVVSQNGSFLDRFGQIDVLRAESLHKLEINPMDHVALRTLGEMDYNAGHLTEAIQRLSEAFRVEPEDLQTRDVLSECLQAALDENFALYRDYLPLLEKVQGPAVHDRLVLLRLKAHGLLEIGDVLGAFAVCREMVEQVDHSFGLLEIGRQHQVALPRWISAQVAALWQQADDLQREQISSELADQIAQLSIDTNYNRVDQFFRCYGTLEICDPVAMQVALHHISQGNRLPAQQLLLRLVQSENPSIASQAVARSAQLLHQADLDRLAASFDAELSTTLANVPCLDGKTGQECLEQWNARPNPGGLNWPYGEVRVSSSGSKHGASRRGSRPSYVEVQLERSGEILGNCNVFLGHNSREVLVRDSQGKEFFRATLDRPSSIPVYGAGSTYGVARGNLLLLSSGQQFLAINTLATGEPGSPQLLWKKQAVSNLDNQLNRLGRRTRRQSVRPGSFRAPRAERDGKWIGVIGPVTHNSCILQDQSRLFCVDPLTGELKWMRSDAPSGCDLFGDEQFVFAVQRGSKKAMVFSTIDGRPLGVTAVPIWPERLATRGRNILQWRKLANRDFELSAIDALSREILWKHHFDKSARIDIARGRFVAVVDAQGNCAVVDADSGERIVDESLPSTASLREVHLLAGADHLILAVQRSATPRQTRQRISLFNSFDYTLFDGQIYVFRRSDGSPTFAGPATVRQQGLMLSQPVDLPVIAFAANLPRQTNSGGGNAMRLLLLEKASGRVLLSDDKLPVSVNYFALGASDSKPNQIVVEMVNKEVRLDFTGKRRPPEPPAMHEVTISKENNPKGLLGIGQKIWGKN